MLVQYCHGLSIAVDADHHQNKDNINKCIDNQIDLDEIGVGLVVETGQIISQLQVQEDSKAKENYIG